MKKPTKISMVENHLRTHGTITSWQAIQLYRATRLAAIIHVLRHDRGLNIDSTDVRSKDGTPFTIYTLKMQPEQQQLGL